MPSYLRKISRAEKHLEDLKPIIADYIESRPYVLAKISIGESGPLTGYNWLRGEGPH